MAYNSNVNIIPGDIVFETFQSGLAIFPFHISARSPYSDTVVSAAKVAPTLTTSQFPTIRNALEISPNGRYVVFTSATVGATTGTGLTIWDLDDNTFTTFASVGFFHRFYFMADSSTMLVASNTAPFIYAFDLVSKVAKGTITGGPTFAHMTMKAAAYGDYLYVIATGSGSTGEVYRYNKTTNAMTNIGIAHAFAFIDIVIEPVKGYLFLSNGSIGTGRYLNVYDLNNLATAPAQISTAGYIASFNGSISSLGFYACSQQSSNALKIGKVTYGASVTATTLADVSPTTTLTVDNSTLICNYAYDNVLFVLVHTPPNAYPNTGKHIRTYDYNTWTSGAINPVINPGPNNDIGAFCVHPGFSRRKFAGHVLSAADAPLAREVDVIERSTNRVIATTTSSGSDGSFTIPIYTTNQCIVVAKGTGAENSKLADYVAPVSV